MTIALKNVPAVRKVSPKKARSFGRARKPKGGKERSRKHRNPSMVNRGPERG
jgi:hypothetical protein